MLDENSSPELLAIAKRAMSRVPVDRFESLDVMADAIENWLKDQDE